MVKPLSKKEEDKNGRTFWRISHSEVFSWPSDIESHINKHNKQIIII